jgi:hypothetical protein
LFPEEVLGCPPKRYIYFLIDLVPGVVSTSKFPYRMSTLELVEMKVQLKDMLNKFYIKMSVSTWGEPTLFCKEKGWYLETMY